MVAAVAPASAGTARSHVIVGAVTVAVPALLAEMSSEHRVLRLPTSCCYALITNTGREQDLEMSEQNRGYNNIGFISITPQTSICLFLVPHKCRGHNPLKKPKL